MISDILSLYDFIDKKLANATVLKSYFSWTGERLHGSDKITIRLHGNTTDKIWFYEIEQLGNFTFVPYPTNPSVNFSFGTKSDSNSRDSKIFRFVESPLAIFASGNEPNVKVDFLILGYIPEDLLDRFAQGNP